jgi:nucleotidyltransferase substrate binding protein (TIGR01987 family)
VTQFQLVTTYGGALIMILDFSSFEKALTSLERVLERSRTVPGDEDIRDACIQRFEYTYELAFKMLKRQLEQELPSSEELDHLPFKEVIRVGAERGLIAMPERWFDYRDKRNITSHTYDEAKAREVYVILANFAADAADLLTLLKSRNA